jgi:hypothetical protein
MGADTSRVRGNVWPEATCCAVVGLGDHVSVGVATAVNLRTPQHSTKATHVVTLLTAAPAVLAAFGLEVARGWLRPICIIVCLWHMSRTRGPAWWWGQPIWARPMMERPILGRCSEVILSFIRLGWLRGLIEIAWRAGIEMKRRSRATVTCSVVHIENSNQICRG